MKAAAFEHKCEANEKYTTFLSMQAAAVKHNC